MKRLLQTDTDNTTLFRTLTNGRSGKNYRKSPHEQAQQVINSVGEPIRHDAANIREFADVVMREALLRQDYPQYLGQSPLVGDTASIRDLRVVVAIAWIQHQLAKGDIDINEIAKTVNLSSSYFRHLFRQETGLTPHRYQRVLRLQRAHDLLCRSFLSVKQVMAELGWTDESHFCRDYKRVFGSSPSKARSKDLKISAKQPTVA